MNPKRPQHYLPLMLQKWQSGYPPGLWGFHVKENNPEIRGRLGLRSEHMWMCACMHLFKLFGLDECSESDADGQVDGSVLPLENLLDWFCPFRSKWSMLCFKENFKLRSGLKSDGRCSPKDPNRIGNRTVFKKSVFKSWLRPSGLGHVPSWGLNFLICKMRKGHLCWVLVLCRIF